MPTPELKTFIQRIFKAELHCHLEGSIQSTTLLKLATHRGVELPFEDLKVLNSFRFLKI